MSTWAIVTTWFLYGGFCSLVAWISGARNAREENATEIEYLKKQVDHYRNLWIAKRKY